MNFSGQVVAMIGTREGSSTTIDTQCSFAEIATILAQRFAIVRTGAAPGYDQFAAQTALRVPSGRVELVLPWAEFERPWVHDLTRRYSGRVSVEVLSLSEHALWLETVEVYHPAPQHLRMGGRRLMARNFGIVDKSIAVVAAPSDKGGGTAQGMRIARAQNKPLFDLTKPEDRGAVWTWLLSSS